MIWRAEHHRIVAVIGAVDFGAIFPPAHGKRWRWRMFISLNPVAIEGHAVGEENARRMIVEHVEAFLAAAGLREVAS